MNFLDGKTDRKVDWSQKNCRKLADLVTSKYTVEQLVEAVSANLYTIYFNDPQLFELEVSVRIDEARRCWGK